MTESMASSHEDSSLTDPLPAEAWDEPGDCAELLEQYNLETKITGRTSGTTLFVVHSKRRDGRLVECEPDQQFKLFLVASSVVGLIEKMIIQKTIHRSKKPLPHSPASYNQRAISPYSGGHTVHTQVAHMDIEIPVAEFQLGHGTAKFLKPDKYAALKREGKQGHCFWLMSLCLIAYCSCCFEII